MAFRLCTRRCQRRRGQDRISPCRELDSHSFCSSVYVEHSVFRLRCDASSFRFRDNFQSPAQFCEKDRASDVFRAIPDKN